jgi:hypothetical protein
VYFLPKLDHVLDRGSQETTASVMDNGSIVGTLKCEDDSDAVLGIVEESKEQERARMLPVYIEKQSIIELHTSGPFPIFSLCRTGFSLYRSTA